MKFILKRLLSHISLLVLLLLLQIALFIWMIQFAANYWQWNIVFLSLSAISVFIVITKDENPAYKLLWIVPILLFPVFGGAFYLFYKQRNFSKKQIRRHLQLEKERYQYIEPPQTINSKESQYLWWQNWPTYSNTSTQFLPSGEAMLAQLLQDIQHAKKFIFIHFFIIKEGKMWNQILEMLANKVTEGIEVTVLYDDVGSVRLPRNYPQFLWEQYKIKAYRFNRIRLRLNFSNNYRSHRKVIVIDNKIGYVTGNNIGDEYINLTHQYGHWNDAGIRLFGKAVHSLTLLFLNTLEFAMNQRLDYLHYLKEESKNIDDGTVIPFGDTPLDKEETTKNIYLSLIASAKKSIKITTPYLIIDHELKNALQYAAKSGVEVTIIIPQVPDKKLVYMVTESHVPILMKSGVQVYCYTPGFIHAKMMIVDDEKAMIGTANLDYRSLYLHFENSVYLANTSSIKDMSAYFTETKAKSELYDLTKKRSFFYRFVQAFLRMFSGLL